MAALRALFHVGVPVTDMEKARAFFCDLLGFAVVGEVTGAHAGPVVGVRGAILDAVLLESPVGRVELLKGGAAAPAELPPRVAPNWHIAFEVTDLDRVLAKTRELGYEVLSHKPFAGPRDHPIIPGMRAAYIEGPGRLTVELVERLD